MKNRVRTLALSGEFVELCDLLGNAVNVDPDEIKTVIDEYGRLSLRPTKKKRVIASSYKWLEAWSVYEALLCNAYGLSMFNEMLAYRKFMLGLFQKYKLPFIITYDYKHRQLLGAARSFNFSSIVDPTLFIMTFDFNAARVNTSKCTKCNSNDHFTQDCPFRQLGQAADLPKSKRGDRGGDKGGYRGSDKKGDKSGDRTSEVCFLFQYGRCKAGNKCHRQHVCLDCGGPEARNVCSKCKKSAGAS